MVKLTKGIINENGHLLRLQAKLQSVQWKSVPEELKALLENLTEMVITNAVGNGGYTSHLTMLENDGREYTRLVQCIRSDPKFIPTVECFISPDGFCHLHVVLTFVGQHDADVDKHVAEDVVNFVCQFFNEPDEEVSIVIHRRWKANVNDKKAAYTTALWGNASLCALNERLIYKQQTVAKQFKDEHNAIIRHLEEITLAKTITPSKDEAGK